MGHIETVVDEIWRLLKPSGVLVALEPDYPAMVEHPPDIATAAIWSASLERSGARPQVGRELPSLLANRGFEVQVDLIERLQPPSPARFQLLRELPLTKEEEAELAEIEERSGALSEWELIVHLPFFLVTARRPGL